MPTSPLKTCPECGAPLPAAGTCEDYFHALLAREWEAPGADETTHFFLVSCYQLQHPDSMGCTEAALRCLARSLTDVLDGRATLDDVRRRSREGAEAAGRVTRREGDPPVAWRRGGWGVTAADVCAAPVERFCEAVREWAGSVRGVLDAEAT